MKNFFTLVFSSTVLFLMSCEKKYGKEISKHIDITVLNQQGQNMLATPAIYTMDDIDVYYVVNGQAQANLNDYKIINEGTSRLRIFLNHDVSLKETTRLTLVKFGSSEIDTIKAEFSYEGRNVSVSKVWFNGELKSREFTIIK